MLIVRRVLDGPNAEVRYCCTIFSEMYEKRRRDAPGTFRNPADKIRHLLVNKIVNVTTCFCIFTKKDVDFTTCVDTLAKISSILRRVFTHFQTKCQFYDVVLRVRTLKYGTVARFFRKSTKNVDETLPEASAHAKGPIDRVSYHSRVRTPYAKRIFGEIHIYIYIYIYIIFTRNSTFAKIPLKVWIQLRRF